MSPHSLGVLGKEVFPEYGWEETSWHHESWQWQGNWSWSILSTIGVGNLVRYTL
jgi:hypothetical protein